MCKTFLNASYIINSNQHYLSQLLSLHCEWQGRSFLIHVHFLKLAPFIQEKINCLRLLSVFEVRQHRSNTLSFFVAQSKRQSLV